MFTLPWGRVRVEIDPILLWRLTDHQASCLQLRVNGAHRFWMIEKTGGIGRIGRVLCIGQCNRPGPHDRPIFRINRCVKPELTRPGWVYSFGPKAQSGGKPWSI